jgi:hypothetical protein
MQEQDARSGLVEAQSMPASRREDDSAGEARWKQSGQSRRQLDEGANLGSPIRDEWQLHSAGADWRVRQP